MSGRSPPCKYDLGVWLGGALAVMSSASCCPLAGAGLDRFRGLGPIQTCALGERWAYRAGPILVASTVFAILLDHTRKFAAPAALPFRPVPQSPSGRSRRGP